LSQEDSRDANNTTRALVLVPTKELAEQVTTFLRSVVRYCDKDVVAVNVASETTAHLQRWVFLDSGNTGMELTKYRVLLSDNPDLVIATPSRALSLLQSKACFRDNRTMDDHSHYLDIVTFCY
jgi:ATP-dependent RNA helicase DDX56/DBP9